MMIDALTVYLNYSVLLPATIKHWSWLWLYTCTIVLPKYFIEYFHIIMCHKNISLIIILMCTTQSTKDVDFYITDIHIITTFRNCISGQYYINTVMWENFTVSDNNHNF